MVRTPLSRTHAEIAEIAGRGVLNGTAPPVRRGPPASPRAARRRGLRWADGVLSPSRQARPSGFRLLGAEATFLTLLDRCAAQSLFVSGSRHAGNYAPRLFSKRPDRDGYSRQDFEAAMHSLYARARITNLGHGKDSRRELTHRPVHEGTG